MDMDCLQIRVRIQERKHMYEWVFHACSWACTKSKRRTMQFNLSTKRYTLLMPWFSCGEKKNHLPDAICFVQIYVHSYIIQTLYVAQLRAKPAAINIRIHLCLDAGEVRYWEILGENRRTGREATVVYITHKRKYFSFCLISLNIAHPVFQHLSQ